MRRPYATFWRTVIHGNVLTPWKTTAVASRPGADRGIVTDPVSGVRSPAKTCRSVVLPHPDGPINAQNSPARTENETSRSAAIGPRGPGYACVSPVTTIGAMAGDTAGDRLTEAERTAPRPGALA